MRRIALVLLAAAALAGGARADPAPPPVDKSAYGPFNPTPADQLRSLCTDRPTKSTGACTVDAGHWQVEADLYDTTIQTGGGVTTTQELLADPTLKLGLTNSLDAEISIAPYERLTVKDHGVTTRVGGVGDLYLRAKQNLLGDDTGDIAVALSPFVKVPTASHAIGNGAVEAGVIAPVQFNLPDSWQLLFDPELDLLENQTGGGRHLSAAGLISLSRPASKTVTVSAELWADANYDPAGAVTQVSADLGVAYIPASRPDLQFDAGVNAGLNKATPGVQAYIGLSHRF